MLDHDERRAGGVEHALDGVAHVLDPGRVEVGGRLIEQEHVRSHRQGPGEREALALPAAQRLGRAIERDVETDRVECLAHPRPDLIARHAEVLATERDVVADPATG